MSQPPDPYVRQFNFANWNITHPGEPHQGDKIDLELNEIRESLTQTQSRLAEIQLDNGYIRPSALQVGIESWTQDIAEKAAEKVYADNLASVADAVLSQNNLLLPAYYPKADGSTLWIYNDPGSPPVFPVVQAAPGQSGTGFGPLPTSTNFSRRFRSAVLFGTQYDYPTRTGGAQSGGYQNTSDRVDNVSMALLYAGTMGWPNNGGLPTWIPTGVFTGYASLGGRNQYGSLTAMPSKENPLATVAMVVDATVNSRRDHEVGHPHPTVAQKAAMDAATTASASNRFATMADVGSGGGGSGLTANQVAAITGSASPSASNVLITNSALTARFITELAGYATTSALDNKTDIGHLHTTLDISDPSGIFSLDSLLADKASVGDLANKADISHTHPISEVDGLQAQLDGKASSTDNGLAKAWVSFDGSTSPPTIKASKNVSSVTKSSAGVYLVNFVAGTFTDANYCWVASGRNNGSNNGLIAGQDNTRKTQTSTQLHIVTRGDDGSLQEATWCNVVVYR